MDLHRYSHGGMNVDRSHHQITWSVCLSGMFFHFISYYNDYVLLKNRRASVTLISHGSNAKLQNVKYLRITPCGEFISYTNKQSPPLCLCWLNSHGHYTSLTLSSNSQWQSIKSSSTVHILHLGHICDNVHVKLHMLQL